MLLKKESPLPYVVPAINKIAVVLVVMMALSWGTMRPMMAVVVQDTDQTSEDSLDSLLGQWRDLEGELVRVEQEFNAAVEETEKQDDLRGRYKALVDQADEMVGQIKSKATTAFKANPNDEKTARLLVGILKNDAEFERFDDAIKVGDQLISAGVDGVLFETAAKSDKISITTRELLEELFIRFNQAKMDTLPQVKIETSKGDLVIELFEDEAPNTVANFINLVEKEFYDGLKFHRVIEGFVAQGGDPEGNGSGGPGYSIECECYEVEARRHFVGSLSMAHAGKDTGGSQFFLCLTRTPNLNELHTVFGRVTSGLEILDRLARNSTPSGPIPNAETDIIKSMKVIRKRDHEYKPVKIGDESKEEPTPPPATPETMQDKVEKASEDGESEDGESEDGGSEDGGSEDGGEAAANDSDEATTDDEAEPADDEAEPADDEAEPADDESEGDGAAEESGDDG